MATAAAREFVPGVPADLSIGSRWTYTSPTTGEVRNYVVESYHLRANIYRLYNADTWPDGPPEDYPWQAAWAPPGTLRGVVKATPGWKPAA